jgi:hypothetical protein
MLLNIYFKTLILGEEATDTTDYTECRMNFGISLSSERLVDIRITKFYAEKVVVSPRKI